jgi:hypothetical protein
MNWFLQLCRNTGLMIHHIRHPAGKSAVERQEVKRTVEEKQVSPTVTLRRTTIEEIEVKKTGPDGPEPDRPASG